MINKKFQKNKILSTEYKNLVSNVLNTIINTDNQKKAFDLFNILEKALQKHKEEIDNNKESQKFYKKVIIKAKFVALPLLDNKDIYDLLNKYFVWQFHIFEYDLLKKIKNKLINTEIVEDRDKFKLQLKRDILKNEIVITDKANLKTISEWLRDYNVKLGINKVDNLKRVQYFTGIKRDKNFSDDDFKKIKVLFDFYEKLKISSSSPEGCEEEVSIAINNKLYIFRHGELESVGKEAIHKKTIGGSPKTQSEKNTDEIKKIGEEYGEQSLEKATLDKEIKKEKNIEELRVMVDKYPTGSLERKAVEEEIKKMMIE